MNTILRIKDEQSVIANGSAGNDVEKSADVSEPSRRPAGADSGGYSSEAGQADSE